MLLAIPVSKSDINLLAKRVELLKKFGPYPRHVLAIAADVGLEQQAKAAFEQLSPMFKQAEMLKINLNGITGWPLASNKHFKLVAQAVHALNIREAFYFFELDNTPMCSGWLDRIHDEYVSANKPYMGCVVPTRGFENGQPKMGEPHMVGTGIYPPNYAAYSAKVPHIDRVALFTGMPMEPFDVAIRHEVVPHSHATKAIQHLWRTCNYRKEGGQIVCDDMPGVTELESHKAPVSPDALVVHGCKDDSLPDLLLGGAVKVEAKPRVIEEKQPEVVDNKHKTFLGQKIYNLVQKPIQVKKLAELLEVTKEQIVAEIGNPANGVVVYSKAQWVKRA